MEDAPRMPEDLFGVSAALHKLPAGGVPERRWHVALVKRTYERICRERVQSAGYEAYVASQRETHVYGSRNRREVERIVIPSLVFVRISDSERVSVMRQCPLLYKFLTNKAASANEFGRHPYAVVPDGQMERLRYMLYHADRPVSFTDQPLRLGESVRVARGALKGLQGNYVRSGGNAYIVIQLGELGCAMASVAITDIERVVP